MSDNKALVDALVKFQRWCDAGGPDVYDQLAARESELAAEAQRRVAEKRG
jgi:ABC-type nitrate/sulfonate/bicarbonate transport system substrate-binding protein